MRQKLTYANAMATIAVFIALGGSAYAATQLAKNSVGSKQLKKNAVTAAKVKNEAITAAKVKKGTLTGTQINASTLGTVPTANSAQTAQTAQTANALSAAEQWHQVGAPGEPQLLNSWQSEKLAFYKDHEGVVHLRGEATDGKPQKPIFELPPGYRPGSRTFLEFAVPCSPCSIGETGVAGVAGEDLIGVADGAVVAPEGATLSVSLSGITFRAEP
jgi:hypothetical protein